VPTSPADAEDLARAVAVIYEDAELALLTILADALAEGIESPRWAELKLAAIGDVRRAVEEVATALQQDATGAIGRAVREAYERGGRAAVAELGALDAGRLAAVARHLPNARAADRLAAAAVEEQEPVWRRILRAPVDVYRSVVARVSSGPLLGTATRRAASQRALDSFAVRGISSFTDRAGRNWSMSAYAEMAVRSTTGRAAIAGHLDALTALGEQLVIVSDAPLECPLCRPWEGEVLAINGASGPHALRLPHAIEDGRAVVVHVAGSLVEARARGLFHPNCRHSLSVFLPGVTQRPEAPPHQQGATYEDTQQQRYLERQVRAWKRKAAAAMDDDARRRANAKVREYQQRIREHTAATGLRRKREREQLPAVNRPRTDAASLRLMSDDDLAALHRSGLADDAARGRIEAELQRRDDAERLAEVFPGGHLADDLAAVDDDTLVWAMQHASPDDCTRIAAEVDRRYPPDPLPDPAHSGDPLADMLADRAAIDAVLGPLPNPDEWGQDDPDWGHWGSDEAAAELIAAAERQDRRGSPDGPERITRAQARVLYSEYVYRQYLDAEDDLRGVLLNARARARGVHPESLFSGPAHVAYANASDELKEWWAAHGRLTQAEFIANATGVDSEAARTARKAESDQQNRR
jgi:hypothetical protein